VMHGGVLQQFGAPHEIYRTPANVFVAGFIGTPAMTLAAGALVADGGPVLAFGAIRLPLAPDAMRDATPRPVTVGVRPEDVVIGPGPFAARVRVFEPTGHECIVIMDADGVLLTARLPGDARLEIGEQVTFALRSPRVHVFDGKTGKRINADPPDGQEGN
jgi:multiple sugar transport system ATP-binding protein